MIEAVGIFETDLQGCIILAIDWSLNVTKCSIHNDYILVNSKAVNIAMKTCTYQ